MSPQFLIEIIFSIIANESEEFPFHHQSQNIPKSIVSFEYKHIDKIVANIYWMFNLCPATMLVLKTLSYFSQ